MDFFTTILKDFKTFLNANLDIKIPLIYNKKTNFLKTMIIYMNAEKALLFSGVLTINYLYSRKGHFNLCFIFAPDIGK
jgi:hypothetical protein